MNLVSLQCIKLTQKSVAFLYAYTNYLKKKLEKIPFVITSKTIKYLGIN